MNENRLRSYKINTGHIFYRLKLQWRKYNREYLKEIVEEALFFALTDKKIFSNSFVTKSNDYIQKEKLYQLNLENSKDLNRFPFPDYALFSSPESNTTCVINYFDSCEVEREAYYFNLFFSIYLSLLDITDETDWFLEYHLFTTFKNDYKDYSDFLKKNIIDYPELLKGNYPLVIDRFIEKNKNLTYKKSQKIRRKSNDFTTARQVLAVHYLLDELNVYDTISKTEVAKFIQFLTGKEVEIANINHTAIYRKVKSPFSLKDKSAKRDLQYLITLFERLGLTQIVEKVNIEIGKKE